MTDATQDRAAKVAALKYLPHIAIRSPDRLIYNTAISDAVAVLSKEEAMPVENTLPAVESLYEKQRRLARLQAEIDLDERIFDMLAGPSTTAGEWTTDEIRSIVDAAIERYLEITVDD